MVKTLLLDWLFDPYLITILFTGLVIGVGGYSMFVLPQKQGGVERQAAKPAPAEELRKAA